MDAVSSTGSPNGQPRVAQPRVKQEADYIFHELTRSICPECKTVIDAQIIIRDNKVFMRKRCPTHGWIEAITAGISATVFSSVAAAL